MVLRFTEHICQLGVDFRLHRLIVKEKHFMLQQRLIYFFKRLCIDAFR